MLRSQVFEASERLRDELEIAFSMPPFDASDRKRVSVLACSLSLEHADAVRLLLANTLVPSALVAHRAQYEAAVRAVWAFYAASPTHIDKLSADLTLDAEQSAKNLPTTHEMMVALGPKAPAPAFQVLSNFRSNSWGALNSFAHAGIHPLKRHEQGYPPVLLEQVQRNANAVALVAAMQAAVLTGSQPLVHEIGQFQKKYQDVLPPLQ
ncbi:MAG: DUF6988 family protein [Burkholderiales bacterium]